MMEKERKVELEDKLKNILEEKTIQMKRGGVYVATNCYYEGDVKGTDLCFGYESRQGLRLFQIVFLSDNKNLSYGALSSINFEDEGLLKDLVCVGQQVIAEEPSDVRNLRDLSTEIEIEGYTFVMTHQSEDVKITGTTLFENYANRVIKRDTV